MGLTEHGKLLMGVRETVLANRSLAENDPENLLKFYYAALYCNKFGRERFIQHVNFILDSNE